MDVFKFGGVAVGSAEALLMAVNHVKRAAPNVAVVVSAANGVTDLLLEAGQAALRGDRETFVGNAKRFEARYIELIADVIQKRARAEELRLLISEASNEMRSMCESISVLREFTQRAQDALVARGERMLARIFTAALNEHGVARRTSTRPTSSSPNIASAASGRTSRVASAPRRNTSCRSSRTAASS